MIENIPDPDVEATEREHESIIPPEYRWDDPELENEDDTGTADDLDDDDEPDPDIDEGSDIALPDPEEEP